MEEIEKVVVAVVEQLQKEAELVGGIQYPSDQPRLVSLTGL
jgi:hypothetical protein